MRKRAHSLGGLESTPYEKAREVQRKKIALKQWKGHRAEGDIMNDFVPKHRSPMSEMALERVRVYVIQHNTMRHARAEFYADSWNRNKIPNDFNKQK